MVIDQLNPLKGEKLIILADPQQMIRAGAYENLRGVIHGRAIELAEEPGLPDGQEVSVAIELVHQVRGRA